MQRPAIARHLLDKTTPRGSYQQLSWGEHTHSPPLSRIQGPHVIPDSVLDCSCVRVLPYVP